MNDRTFDSLSSRQGITDLFSRTISYLRLSLTDRCNLRCLYCVSEHERHGGRVKLPHTALLSYEELLRVVRVATELGISKVRLTGGEPLVRRGVMDFISGLSGIPGLRDIRLTTNGVLLEKYAARLLDAGVGKINVSLDTLRPERFAAITGSDCFDRVWRGLNMLWRLDFPVVKINMVVMRGVNADELLDFAALALEKKAQVRFIEFMPIGGSTSWRRDLYMSVDQIMAVVGRLGSLTPAARGLAAGPAKVYRLGDSPGSLGFISPISHQFCDQCNRLRLTSEGGLRSCLLRDDELDLREVIRRGGTDEDIGQALITAVRNKPRGHDMAGNLPERGGDCHGRMSRIGG